MITGRYPDVDVAAVENKPESTPKRESLAEDLADAGAEHDAELVEAARQVIAAVKAHNAAIAPVLGIDLERVEAAAQRVRSVTSDGTGGAGAGRHVHRRHRDRRRPRPRGEV